MFIYLIVILFLGLFILLLVPTMILSLIMRVLSSFGIGRKTTNNNQRTGARYQNTEKQWHDSPKQQKNDEKKVLFEKNEGEYVDFEEIKD